MLHIRVRRKTSPQKRPPSLSASRYLIIVGRIGGDFLYSISLLLLLGRYVLSGSYWILQDEQLYSSNISRFKLIVPQCGFL